MVKITVIGAGNVGSTIAYSLTLLGIAAEIVMIDLNDKKADGEAIDIRQGTPFTTPCSIYAGTYSDAVGSDIVIITSGIPRRHDQTRLDLAQVNVDMLRVITPEITKYAPYATYVIVSNPVDILTYAFGKFSGLPASRVIGSGTILDTSRLRARLSEIYDMNQHNVHAYVLGEHGDSSLIPWSLVNISNVPIEAFGNCCKQDGKPTPAYTPEEVEEYVHRSGTRVIERKGATYYAVSVAVCHICKCLMSAMDTTLTVSTLLNGEYGINDVCMSLLNIVGRHGAHGKVILPLTDKELEQLYKSAATLKDVIKQLRI